MRLSKRMIAARLSRIRERAASAAQRHAQPPLHIVAAGSSAACGTAAASETWRDKAHGRRVTERVPVTSHVSVRRAGGFPFDCRLEDVSAGGCKVELVEGTEIAERVIARFPSLEPFGASVAWVEARFAGLAFDRTMHPAVFAHLLSRLA
jgi:hypothetical protein